MRALDGQCKRQHAIQAVIQDTRGLLQERRLGASKCWRAKPMQAATRDTKTATCYVTPPQK